MSDFISRQAAIDACYDGCADCRDDCTDNIRNLPPADVRPADCITANDYQRAAMRTATGDKSEWLENAIYGLIGETGEIVDLVKKHKWQGHELDKEALILECGDLAWYQSLLASALDTTLGEVYQKNIEKLEKRYPSGFSKDRSINRDDG